MGYANAKLLAIEEEENRARDFLVRTNAIRECENHGGIHIDQFDPDAVAKAVRLATKTQTTVSGKRRIKVLVNEALADSGVECSHCAMNFGD